MLRDYYHFCPRSYRILAWLLIPLAAVILGCLSGYALPDLSGGWTVDTFTDTFTRLFLITLPTGVLEVFAGGKMFNGFGIFHDGEPGFLAASASDRWHRLFRHVLVVDAIRRFLVYLVAWSLAVGINNAMAELGFAKAAGASGGIGQTFFFVCMASLVVSVAGLLSSVAVSGFGMYGLMVIIMALLQSVALLLILIAGISGNTVLLLLPAAAGLITYFRKAYRAGTALRDPIETKKGKN